MTIVLGAHRYGKAETRVLKVTRDGETHRIRDLNVSISVTGDLSQVYLSGDNSAALPTDSQKNTVYAFAREHGIGSPEEFALRLARHFVASQEPIRTATVAVQEYAWDRIPATGHSFVRRGQEIRTARVVHSAEVTYVVSGLRDLVVLNSAGSEFWGFPTDRYTTLQETTDRILATSVTAQWRHAGTEGVWDRFSAWDRFYGTVRDLLLETFAATHSLSLQQTLATMGRRVLEEHPGIAEIRFEMPNKHHFEVDLAPFGLDNPGEVFFAADRPYGLIEGAVLRDDAPPAPEEIW